MTSHTKIQSDHLNGASGQIVGINTYNCRVVCSFFVTSVLLMLLLPKRHNRFFNASFAQQVDELVAKCQNLPNLVDSRITIAIGTRHCFVLLYSHASISDIHLVTEIDQIRFNPAETKWNCFPSAGDITSYYCGCVPVDESREMKKTMFLSNRYS